MQFAVAQGLRRADAGLRDSSRLRSRRGCATRASAHGCWPCATTRTRRARSASTPGASSSAPSCCRAPSPARPAPSTCRSSCTSTRASPSARTCRWRRWWAPIVGGMGTLWGPVLGAVVLHTLADLTRNLFGAVPGHQPGDLRRRAGADRDVPAARPRRTSLDAMDSAPEPARTVGRLRRAAGRAIGEPGRDAGTLTGADRPERCGQDHAVRDDLGLPETRQRAGGVRRPRHHRACAAPERARRA